MSLLKESLRKIKNKLSSKKEKTKEEIDADFFNSPEYKELCEQPYSPFGLKVTHISSESLNNEEYIRDRVIA